MHFKNFLISCFFSFVVIIGWNNTASALWGSGEKTISPDKVLFVSTLENDQTVTVYLGGDKENYIDVVIKSSHIKEGAVVRSEDGSISTDGLGASAQWKSVRYFSSSKHPTFVIFKIQSLDMNEQKAVIQISAKLVDPNNNKYLQFDETSFELTGDLFKEFTKFTKGEVIELTSEQIGQVEKTWGGVLFAHKDKLINGFDQFKPNDYQGFAVFKVKEWLTPFNHNHDIMRSQWEKLGQPSGNPDFQTAKDILLSMTVLNIVSIKMKRYLEYNKSEDLQFINDKIAEISSLSNQYRDYQPPHN